MTSSRVSSDKTHSWPRRWRGGGASIWEEKGREDADNARMKGGGDWEKSGRKRLDPKKKTEV